MPTGKDCDQLRLWGLLVVLAVAACNNNPAPAGSGLPVALPEADGAFHVHPGEDIQPYLE